MVLKAKKIEQMPIFICCTADSPCREIVHVFESEMKFKTVSNSSAVYDRFTLEELPGISPGFKYISASLNIHAKGFT